MSKRESISRYHLIINKLRKGAATFEEIADFLDRQSELEDYNFRISKRTFQRDLDDIRELFKIDIQFDRHKKAYCIDDEEKPELTERILEAFDTFNALGVSDRLSQHIHFEKRKPQGTENLYGLLHAIKNKLQIKFTYQKFWEEESSQRIAEPYGLKEFENRWYVIAKDHKDKEVKSFALDRLSELDITKQKFEFPADFNIEKAYRYCFGIISPNGEEPQEIILSFEPHQGKYIKTLPLHETQEILIDNDDELQIKLKLCITFDFEMELLKYGDKMKVIKPKSLSKTLKEEHKKAFTQYQ